MYEELKKAALKKWRKRAIVSVILGLLCFIPTGLFHAIYKDIDSVSRKDWTSGCSIIFQVSESSGEIAEEYKNTMDKESSEKYAASIFLLPEADEAAKMSDTVSGKSAYYAAVTVDGSEKGKMKKLAGLSMDGSKEAKPVTFYGYLREMTPMEMIYTGEHLVSKGADQETIDALMLDYNFVVEGSRPYLAIGFAILGIILILRGFCLLIKANEKAYGNEVFKNTRKAGFDDEIVKQDLLDAKAYANKHIFIGRQFTFVNLQGNAPAAIENDKIRWVYSKDGFISGTNAYMLSALMLGAAGFAIARLSTIGESSNPPTVLGIYAEGNRNPYFVGIGRMKACLDEIFADLQKRNPGIEIGYSRYIEKEFRKNHR